MGNPPGGHLFGVLWPRRVRHLHRLGGCAHFQRSRLPQSTPASKRPLAASLVPVGTVLTAVSVFQDGLSLLYTTYRSCKKHCCCSSCCRETPGNNLTRDLAAENPDERGRDCKKSRDKESDDEIDDPCKCCYHCGCNVATRNETLGAITLWFQDIPMLTIAVLYAFSQSTCKVPDSRDVTPVLRDIGISALAATLAAIWRLFRSFFRLYANVGTRIKEKIGSRSFLKCLPKKGEAVYPAGSRAQCCIFGFYFGLLMQRPAVFLGGVITLELPCAEDAKL